MNAQKAKMKGNEGPKGENESKWRPQRRLMKANEGPRGQNKRKWNQPQPETLEDVVALWSRKQKLRKQGRGSPRKGYMWKVCRGSWRCGRGSTAEAVAEAMSNFLSTRKEKKTHICNVYHVCGLAGFDIKVLWGTVDGTFVYCLLGFSWTCGEKLGMTADIEKMAFVLRFICLTMTSLCERRLATSWHVLSHENL